MLYQYIFGVFQLKKKFQNSTCLKELYKIRNEE